MADSSDGWTLDRSALLFASFAFLPFAFQIEGKLDGRTQHDTPTHVQLESYDM